MSDIRWRTGFRGLSLKDVFEKVYTQGAWGRDAEGKPTSGYGSHEGTLVAPYVATLRAFLTEQENPSVVDLGCGDFNVGNKLQDLAGSYLACDISETILNRNRRKYQDTKVEFRQLDLSVDELPKADVCFVRQVLQHLGNAEIGRFVAQLHERQPYRYLIVTEHVAVGEGARPNLGMRSGPGVRLGKLSGVDLVASPFHLRHLDAEVLLSIPCDEGAIPAQLVTTVYRLPGKVNKLVTSGARKSSLGSPGGRIV